MVNKSWFILATLLSCSSYGGSHFHIKQLKVEALMKLQKLAPALAFESYQRELVYEKNGLSLDQRAQNETNLLADKIRLQVSNAYKAAVDRHESPELAKAEIRAQIEKDLELVDPKMKEELSLLAQKTLENIDSGSVSESVNLENVQAVILKQVEARNDFLNEEISDAVVARGPEKSFNDGDRKEYKNKAEILESLVSERESSRWVSTSSQTINTGEVTSVDSKVSMQVKVSFLGATLDAGPSINFRKKYSTSAVIMAEGMSPVIIDGGNFDFWKRDAYGKIVVKNGQQTKRYAFFTCDADLSFTTDYAGAGGFSFMGVGGNASVSKSFSNTVSLSSRRIALPEYVGNQSVTVKYISELCHKDFLNAHLNKALTVTKSLDVMMKNVVAGLTFSHPKTKCIKDEHCYNWFNHEIISLAKLQNFPRCREDNGREQFFSCQLRGLQGQNCAVYENGKRTSDGQFEFTCDVGLKCVKYQSQSFFLGAVWEYAKGKCQVIDKKNYRNPFDIANDSREIDGIEIELQN